MQLVEQHLSPSREIPESMLSTTTSAFMLELILLLISYVVQGTLVNLPEFHFSHLQNRADNTRISESVSGTCSEGLRKLVGKVRHRPMAMIRGTIRNVILIEVQHGMEAKKDNYKFLVIQAGKGFPFMKCLIGIQCVGGRQQC